LKKGYFDDFGEFRKHKGKLFLADGDLSDERNSNTFPTTEVHCRIQQSLYLN